MECRYNLRMMDALTINSSPQVRFYANKVWCSIPNAPSKGDTIPCHTVRKSVAALVYSQGKTYCWHREVYSPKGNI